jgi:hypothetical protein
MHPYGRFTFHNPVAWVAAPPTAMPLQAVGTALSAPLLHAIRGVTSLSVSTQTAKPASHCVCVCVRIGAGSQRGTTHAGYPHSGGPHPRHHLHKECCLALGEGVGRHRSAQAGSIHQGSPGLHTSLLAASGGYAFRPVWSDGNSGSCVACGPPLRRLPLQGGQCRAFAGERTPTALDGDHPYVYHCLGLH